MTFEERMAELGVDLSDLPAVYGRDEQRYISDHVYEWAVKNNYDPLTSGLLYVLHLTEIIDRMETRLANVIGERDFLKHIVNEIETCAACAHIGNPDYCTPCINTDGTRFEPCEGVPEDWRPDND